MDFSEALRAGKGGEMMRPISEAPLDGTPVLAIWPSENFDPSPAHYEVELGWCHLNSDMSVHVYSTQPTHFILMSEIKDMVAGKNRHELIPQGWCVAPIEPTPEMQKAGIEADDKRTGGETCAHIYRAMIEKGRK